MLPASSEVACLPPRSSTRCPTANETVRTIPSPKQAGQLPDKMATSPVNSPRRHALPSHQCDASKSDITTRDGQGSCHAPAALESPLDIPFKSTAEARLVFAAPTRRLTEPLAAPHLDVLEASWATKQRGVGDGHRNDQFVQNHAQWSCSLGRESMEDCAQGAGEAAAVSQELYDKQHTTTMIQSSRDGPDSIDQGESALILIWQLPHELSRPSETAFAEFAHDSKRHR